MAVSGTISTTTFDTRRVIDTAFRRCRLPAQAITAEMQDYAQDALYLLLSDLANVKTPSWCIDRLLLPFELNNPQLMLPAGTVEVLNVNYRICQPLSPTVLIDTSSEYQVQFESASQVSVIGVTWIGAPVVLTVQTSSDALTWTTVATLPVVSAVAGDLVWSDLVNGSAVYFRVTGTGVSATFQLQTLPQEIPLGPVNRDTYTAIPNKVFTSRQPTNFWFQRDRVNPVLNMWPAPNASAVASQLVVWRHRHIMDVGTLAQEIEVPQRWLEAIIDGLAARMAAETSTVDMQLIPMLETKAAQRLQVARDGDNDGSPTYIQPAISAYTA